MPAIPGWLGKYLSLTMANRKTPPITAIFFFIFWLVILYAGADHPPPPGFLWVIILDLFASLLVFLRVPVYLEWHTSLRKFRLQRIGLEGMLAGLAFAAFTLIVTTRTEPGIAPSLLDRLIWMTVLAGTGTTNALFVNFLSILIDKGFQRRTG